MGAITSADVECLNRALTGICWEAILFDDDSPDGTADMVRRWRAGKATFAAFSGFGRRGLASACIEGIFPARLLISL